MFHGGKGGGSTFKQTPDNLRSTDTFEGVLGVCVGPVKGPTRGLKSLRLDGTPIENETGELNFTDFVATVADGDPGSFPQPVELKLGAGASPQQVGVSIVNPNQSGGAGPWQTRTMNNTNANFMDLRFIAQQLFSQTKKGIFEATATLEIEMKPVGSSTWINPTISTPTGTYREQGTTLAGSLRQYIPRSYYNEAGQWRATEANYKITGKTTGPAVYELRIGLPSDGVYADTRWDVRVRLVERDSYTDAEGVNQEKRTITWESIAAVYGKTIGTHEDWRGLAWLQIYGKASDQLTGVPEIDGEWDTKIISVPTSGIYNPTTRQYTNGLWDGSWSKAWCNDPAWVINDAISDSLSGLSLVARGSYLNKWDALEASKWYSELVPDGDGGTQPRYSMNLSISQPQKAEDFIRYLAGATGSLAWDQGDGMWRLKCDKPENPVDLFTLDSIEGEFVYSHTDVDTRFNDMTGQFKNAEMDYRQDAVQLFDNPSIALIGRKPTTIALVGCTNRQEAMRRIKLRLRTSVNENQIVNFTTNRRGRNIEMLDTILIADGDLGDQNKRTTGRAVSIAPDRRSLVLRDPVYLAPGVAYRLWLTVPNPAYKPDIAVQPISSDWTKPTRAISYGIVNTSGQRGSVNTLYLDDAMLDSVDANVSVALEAVDLPTMPRAFRVTNVVVQDDGERIAISGINIDTGKWSAADNVSKEDTVFQDLRGAVPPPRLPPSGRVLSLVRVPVEQGNTVNLIASWTRPPGAFVSGFSVRYSINGGPMQTAIERTQDTNFEWVNPSGGLWRVEVVTHDRRGGVSLPLTDTFDVNQEVLDAADIRYEDGRTVQEFQPFEPQATRGAPNGTPVGDSTAELVLARIRAAEQAIQSINQLTQDIIQDIDNMTTGPGGGDGSASSSAAASADAAERSADIAEAAAINAATARDGAQSARLAADNALKDAKAAAAAAAISVRDANGYATTASGAAATATQKADAAGQSATSAAASVTTASTKAGEASASASRAATSENNAKGSETAASTSAGVAATNATNAKNSADAASFSASTASTKSDAASSSAAAATSGASRATTAAGTAEANANSAATSAQNADGAATRASSQANLAAAARTAAENSSSAATSAASLASSKASEAEISARAAQSSQVRATSSALDAVGHATGNIVGRGRFDSLERGNWLNTATVKQEAAGNFYVLEQTTRHVTEGDLLIGDWSGRKMRITGNAAVFGAYGAKAGLELLMSNGTLNYAWITAGTPGAGYRDFTGEVDIPAGVVSARPSLLSDGAWGAANHGVRWRSVRIEDITQSALAKGSAEAASTSYANAEIKASEAGSFAQSASGSANTALVQAGAARNSASAAAGSATTATEKAASAAQSAALVASVAGSAANLLPNSDFSGPKEAGWVMDPPSPSRFFWGIDPADFRLAGEHYFGVLGLERSSASMVELVSDWVAVDPGSWVQASAWMACRECSVSLRLQWGDGGGGFLAQGPSAPTVANNSRRGGPNLDGFSRVWTKGQVPSNARYARIVARKDGWVSNAPNDLSWMFLLRPMLAYASAGQDQPSAYAPRGAGAAMAAATAEITSIRQVAASAGQSAAQVQENLNATAGSLSAQLNTTSQVAAVAFDRVSGARWSKEAVSPAGRAQLTVYSFNDGSTNSGFRAGIDMIGNVTIRGDLLVDGTVSTTELANNAATQVWYSSSSRIITPISAPSSYTTMLSMIFTKNAGSESVIQFDVQCPMYGDDAVKVEVFLDIWNVGGTTLYQNRGFRMEVDGNNETYLPFIYQHLFQNLGPGTYEARFVMRRTSGHYCQTTGLYHMMVREFKR